MDVFDVALQVREVLSPIATEKAFKYFCIDMGGNDVFEQGRLVAMFSVAVTTFVSDLTR